MCLYCTRMTIVQQVTNYELVHFGIINENNAPFPSALFCASILPPCDSTIFWTQIIPFLCLQQSSLETNLEDSFGDIAGDSLIPLSYTDVNPPIHSLCLIFSCCSQYNFPICSKFNDIVQQVGNDSAYSMPAIKKISFG